MAESRSRGGIGELVADLGLLNLKLPMRSLQLRHLNPEPQLNNLVIEYYTKRDPSNNT